LAELERTETFPLLIIFNKIFYSGTLGDNQPTNQPASQPTSPRHHEKLRQLGKNLIRFSFWLSELSILPASSFFSILWLLARLQKLRKLKL